MIEELDLYKNSIEHMLKNAYQIGRRDERMDWLLRRITVVDVQIVENLVQAFLMVRASEKNKGNYEVSDLIRTALEHHGLEIKDQPNNQPTKWNWK